jgi:hypothetical protein
MVVLQVLFELALPEACPFVYLAYELNRFTRSGPGKTFRTPTSVGECSNLSAGLQVAFLPFVKRFSGYP